MTENSDPFAYNRAAWDREVDQGNEWTRPVGPDVIARARAGDWSVVLIGYEPVPRDWFPADLAGTAVLCLASGGGQQGPVLAAAGADVTVFDNSPRQLGRDEEVAARDGLAIRTVLGDMRDLSAFADGRFDLVFNPVSNVFCPDLAPVWRECFRVLRPAGVLLTGIHEPGSVHLRRRGARYAGGVRRTPPDPLFQPRTCPRTNAGAPTAMARSSTATR